MDDETNSQPDLEHLWQFAGQGLRSSDFNTAMVHFYRGEISRSNAWRARLDATTNWAVITTGASLTFAFSSVDNPPVVLIFNTLLVLLFLFIETRRYRYYELWTNRVRIMEQNFYVGLLSPPFMPHTDWAEKITDSLKNPRFPIGIAEAFGRRYRRNYAPIFLIMAFSWIVKIAIHPTEVSSFGEFMQRASFGPLSGWVMLAVGMAVHGILIGIGLFTVGLHDSTGEVVSPASHGLGRIWERLRVATSEVFEIDVPRIQQFDNRKQLVYIISDHAELVSQHLLTEMKHGVTLLQGKGMYTGKEHGVMLSAMEARQIKKLKKEVYRIDPGAFVIISPISEVRGKGFRPLEA